MYHYDMMYYAPFHFLGGVLHFVFWVFVIALIIRFIRRRKHMHHNGWHGMWSGSNAIETLRERYAKGEIDKTEYEERKKTLEQ